MKRAFFGLSLLALCTVPAIARNGERGLVVHEWGTFLAMAGSDGATLDGMYHEEHALPPFVHARSKDQLRLRSVSLKGETPVIYFYTDRRLDVNVRVKFPEGIWTQWYPQASMVAPGLAATVPTKPRGGQICWNVEAIPPGDGRLADGLPSAHSDALWNYSRQVDAAFIRAKGSRESERFIFYRGLGKASLPLTFSFASNGSLKLGGLPGGGLKHLFVIRVENGSASYRYIPALAAGDTLEEVIPSLQGATDVSEFSRRIGADLSDRLVQSGLYRKEAEAMVNTWRSSYFESEGVRVLFVLPQEWTESFIPMTVSPKPARTVRVMVGRTELLTPAHEARAASAISQLRAKDAAVRDKAFGFLRAQGRYVEPIVNRVMGATDDEKVRRACKALLMTSFVTELRSAVHSAADGSKVEENPAEIRANLAALLRELGHAKEAADEANRAEQDLSRIKPPTPEHPDLRWYLRAFARAREGLGDDRGALGYYEKLVRFGSLSKTCGGCHEAAGPRTMAFYRDWWAGRKFAETAEKLGVKAETIRAQRETLARDPANTAAQMMLAYLGAGEEKPETLNRLWAAIEGRPGTIARLNEKPAVRSTKE